MFQVLDGLSAAYLQLLRGIKFVPLLVHEGDVGYYVCVACFVRYTCRNISTLEYILAIDDMFFKSTLFMAYRKCGPVKFSDKKNETACLVT